MEQDYIRIGTTYYKKVQRPLVSGKFAISLQPWSVECIKQDYGKSFLSSIPKYDGFCFVPGHLDYKREIGKFYNSYHPFPHEPQPGYPRVTLIFLNHVFGDQLDLGLDYLKILLLYPTQMLPILCLVSTERNTGKTTFLNFLKAIFGDNMTINSNEDFRSNFNAEWAHKLLIGVDETFLDRKEIEFFGKFVLCSNNEDNFIQIDPGEIRYWIRRLPVLSQDNKGILTELRPEIPCFIHYLVQRPFTTLASSRMWFCPEQIATAALQRIKRFNQNKLEGEIVQILLFFLDNREGVQEIAFCISDVQDWLLKKGWRGQDAAVIRRLLQYNWKLQPSSNSNAYLQYRIGPDGKIYEFNQKGRFYALSKKEILTLNNIDDFDEKKISC
jgi:hypothetical protein